MVSFKDFLKEYNTTGEVDTENNTDLDKPVNKTRWWASKRKCGLGGLPCSKYSAQMKKENMKSFYNWLSESTGSSSLRNLMNAMRAVVHGSKSHIYVEMFGHELIQQMDNLSSEYASHMTDDIGDPNISAALLKIKQGLWNELKRYQIVNVGQLKSYPDAYNLLTAMESLQGNQQQPASNPLDQLRSILGGNFEVTPGRAGVIVRNRQTKTGGVFKVDASKTPGAVQVRNSQNQGTVVRSLSDFMKIAQ